MAAFATSWGKHPEEADTYESKVVGGREVDSDDIICIP